MPPTDRFVCCFAAEPPQEGVPYGRWAERLREEFLAAILEIDSEGEDLGTPGDIVFYPDRSYGGRTYIPATTRTTTDFEIYGHVNFATPQGERGPDDFAATADFTAETADANPEWQLDLCEDVIGTWRGEAGNVAQMTLVWGRPLIKGGTVVTAELADLAVDQCEIVDDQFTLIAPDAYRQDVLDIKVFDASWRELARESLYEDDDAAEDDDDDESADDDK